MPPTPEKALRMSAASGPPMTPLSAVAAQHVEVYTVPRLSGPKKVDRWRSIVGKVAASAAPMRSRSDTRPARSRTAAIIADTPPHSTSIVASPYLTPTRFASSVPGMPQVAYVMKKTLAPRPYAVSDRPRSDCSPSAANAMFVRSM